jgi:hypothetical protein
LNKGLTLITLLSTVNAVNPFTRNDQSSTLWFNQFPMYSDNAVTLFKLTIAEASALSYTVSGTVKHGGYQCIRSGQIYSFP